MLKQRLLSIVVSTEYVTSHYPSTNNAREQAVEVVTHLPLTQAARVQLPDAALSSLTQAIIPRSGSVKCVATSIQWVTAVEDCEYT